MPPNRLREIRKARGLTLQAVGARAGISHVQLSRLEKGDRRLKDTQISALARALEVSPQDLLETEVVAISGTVGITGQQNSAIVVRNHTEESAAVPRGLKAGDVECIKIVGSHFSPILGDGWLAFYLRPAEGEISPDAVGRLCVCHSQYGETLLAQILRAPEPGLYNLVGINSPIVENVDLAWAAPVVELVSPLAAASFAH